MYYFKLIFLFFLLYAGKQTVTAHEPAGALLISGSSFNLAFSEDIQSSSPCHLAAKIDFSIDRISPSSPAIFFKENNNYLPVYKAFISKGQIPEPGLSLGDIIFPFHTFL